MPAFDHAVRRHNPQGLRRGRLQTLQFNLGRLCNLTCSHCHVEAGPTKTLENSSLQTVLDVIAALDRLKPECLDLTGGAPEMNPHFKMLVQEGRSRGIQVIDRSNLTIFYETGFKDLPAFLAEHQVTVIASLPCYAKENVEKQRGKGVFDLSIQALKLLNEQGYARLPELELHLVYNPGGPSLPPDQQKLERDYRIQLKDLYDIDFNHLYTLTNMPITRYRKYLEAIGAYDAYVHLLEKSFQPENLAQLMCLSTLSVGWDGMVYDCDFNQALNMPAGNPKKVHISVLQPQDLAGFEIKTGDHCYGCTAGAGSSCTGSLNSR